MVFCLSKEDEAVGVVRPLYSSVVRILILVDLIANVDQKIYIIHTK